MKRAISTLALVFLSMFLLVACGAVDADKDVHIPPPDIQNTETAVPKFGSKPIGDRVLPPGIPEDWLEGRFGRLLESLETQYGAVSDQSVLRDVIWNISLDPVETLSAIAAADTAIADRIIFEIAEFLADAKERDAWIYERVRSGKEDGLSERYLPAAGQEVLARLDALIAQLTETDRERIIEDLIHQFSLPMDQGEIAPRRIMREFRRDGALVMEAQARAWSEQVAFLISAEVARARTWEPLLYTEYMAAIERAEAQGVDMSAIRSAIEHQYNH